MSKDRHKIIPSVYMMLEKDGRILLARRANTGFMDGMYSFPAGHLDGNETLAQAAVREAKEEAAVSVKVEDVELVHVISRKGNDGERVGLVFRSQKWSGEPRINEPDKCDDMQWFALDKLPENMVDYVKIAVGHIQNGVRYSEFGW